MHVQSLLPGAFPVKSSTCVQASFTRRVLERVSRKEHALQRSTSFALPAQRHVGVAVVPQDRQTCMDKKTPVNEVSHKY